MGIQIGPPCRGLRQDIALPAVLEAPIDVGDRLEIAYLRRCASETPVIKKFNNPAVWCVKALLDALIVGPGKRLNIIASEVPADEGSLLVLVIGVNENCDDSRVCLDIAGAQVLFVAARVDRGGAAAAHALAADREAYAATRGGALALALTERARAAGAEIITPVDVDVFELYHPREVGA